MKQITIYATLYLPRKSIMVKLELNGHTFDIEIGSSLGNIGIYESEIDTLALFKFIRENMDLKTINQFKQLEEIKE
jgi:hypothetical protein